MKRGPWRNSSSGLASITANGWPLDTTVAKKPSRCGPRSTSCGPSWPKRGTPRDDDIESATHPRPRHHPVHALPQEALGCADRRLLRLRGHLQEVRPNMDGELTVAGRPSSEAGLFPKSRLNATRARRFWRRPEFSGG